MFSPLSLFHKGSSTNTPRVSISRSHDRFNLWQRKGGRWWWGGEEGEVDGGQAAWDFQLTLSSPPVSSLYFLSEPQSWPSVGGLGNHKCPRKDFFWSSNRQPHGDLEPGSSQAREVLILFCPGAPTSWEGEGFRYAAVWSWTHLSPALSWSIVTVHRAHRLTHSWRNRF